MGRRLFPRPPFPRSRQLLDFGPSPQVRRPLAQRDVPILIFLDLVARLLEAALRLVIIPALQLPDAGVQGVLVGAEATQQLADVLVLSLVGGEPNALGHRRQRRDLWTCRFPSRPPGGVDRRHRGFQRGCRRGRRRGLVALDSRGPLRADSVGFGLDGGQNFFAAFLLFVHSFVYTLLANILLWKRP